MRPSIDEFTKNDLQCIAITEVLTVDFPVSDELPSTSSLNEVVCIDDSEDNYPTQKTRVLIFGTTLQGHSVALDCRGYQPTLIFEFQGHQDTLENFLHRDALAKRKKPQKLRIKQLKRFYGQVPSKTNPLEAQLFDQQHVSVDSLQDLNGLKRRLSSEFSSNIQFVNEQLKTSTAFCNEQGLVMSSWMSVHPDSIQKLKNRDDDPGWSTCQIEVDVDLTKVQSLKALELNDVPPWIAVSFDCEMMSYDGLFPATTKGDHTVCLCATVWNVKQGPSSAEKHAWLLVDKVTDTSDANNTFAQSLAKEQGLIVHAVSSSFDLLLEFRNFLVEYDVDLITGWNIQGFDMPFLWADLSNYMMDHFLLRGTQSLAIEASNQAGISMPSSDDLLQRLRLKGQASNAKQALSSLLHKQPTLPKQASEWPESIARPFRASLSKLLDEPVIAVPMLSKDTVQKWADSELKTVLLRLAFDGRPSDLAQAFQWGRIRTEKSKLELRNMSSAAKGDNTYSIWSATGRVTVDLMQIIKDDKKPESNSLRFAAETWLDKSKLKKDLEPSEMFDAQACGRTDTLDTLMDQCIRDAEIPMLLIDKLSQVSTWIEMSRVTQTSLSQVLNGGQQRKVFNVIARFVHQEQAINVRDSGWPDTPDDDTLNSDDPLAKRKPDQQGATVIEPDPGHQETPVSVLDFESLQPSIIIFFNLCASNLILDLSETELHRLKTECRGFDYEVHCIEHNILVNAALDEYKTEVRKYIFVKHIAGVLPRLLRHLLKSRKAVKALMAAETDVFQKNVLNGRQNGLKIVCNSVYGFCGTRPSKGLLSCKPVAAVTTLKGRAFIDAAKKQVEDHQKAHVLQGDTDSIMILWPTKDDGTWLSIPEAFAFGEEASKKVTEVLRSGIALDVTRPLLVEAQTAVTLANEKVQCPYLLLKKKNQAGLKWTPSKKGMPDDWKGLRVSGFGAELDMKGIDAVRRDRTKFVRELSEVVLEKLLIENNAKLSIEVLSSKIDDLTENRVAIDDFVLSKSLKGSYANANVPHVQAWLRMKERGDAGCPEKGGRMPIVMVEPYGAFAKMHRKKVPLYQRCEHPEFVKKNPLIQLSRSQYLDGLSETFDRLYKPTQQHAQVLQLFTQASEKIDHLDSKNSSLRTFFSEKASSDLDLHEMEVVTSSKEKETKKRVKPTEIKASKKVKVQSMSLFGM